LTADFDLNYTPYHLMLATGSVKDGSYVIQQHTNKGVTDQPISMAQFNPFIKSNSTTTTSTAPVTTTMTTVMPGNDSSIYASCYATKGCFGTPSGCVEKRNCNYLVTYSRLSEASFRFEIGQVVGSSVTNSYAAFGLSFDDKMGDDSVMACTLSAGGQVDVAMYWNVAKPSYNSLPLQDPHFGLTVTAGSLTDGFLLCSFDREAVTQVPKPDNTSQLFDLGLQKFFLFLAAGTLDVDGHLLQHTSKERSASAQVTTGLF
jgi:hypothetical protein